MSSSLVNGLFVFMLAAFIGFEVIRRVSPLLHTPLMSLTNALDAIAVVGAIVLWASTRADSHYARHAGGDRRYQQRRRRIFDHRPHAQNVQGEPPKKIMNTSRDPADHRVHIPDRQRSLHSVPEMDEFAKHGAARSRAGELECSWLLAARCSATTLWITSGWPSRWCWARIGVPLGLVQMTAVPQRTALSHAFGAFCVTLVGTAEFYLRSSRGSPLHDGRAFA